MMQPDSYIWKALELYGTRIHHRGQWRIHKWLRNKLGGNCDRDFEVQRLGLRWVLNPSDFVQSSFYWTGEFETWDWFHLSRLIQPHSIVCDVGANFGFYSVMAGRQLTPPGRVFAFEPCGETLSRLQTNIRLNHLEHVVTIVPLALSDHQGTGYLANARPDDRGGANDNSGARALSSTGERISLDTLDHVCSEQKIARVDVIKIDVEGHELAVLAGAAKTITALKPVIMVECNDVALQRSGASTREMYDKLCSWGYRLFLPRRKTLVPLSSLPAAGEIINIFALPKEEDR